MECIFRLDKMQTRQSGGECVAHSGTILFSPGQDAMQSAVERDRVLCSVTPQCAVLREHSSNSVTLQSAVLDDAAGCLPGQDAVQGSVHRGASGRWWEEEGRKASKNLEMSHQLLRS